MQDQEHQITHLKPCFEIDRGKTVFLGQKIAVFGQHFSDFRPLRGGGVPPQQNFLVTGVFELFPHKVLHDVKCVFQGKQ